MKTVVSLQDLLDSDIRPDALLAEYQERVARDLAVRWAGGLREVGCPGCGRADAAPAFVRLGMQYRECATCGSLFVSPRPSEAEIVRFYRDSDGATFWREQFWPRTEAMRREKIVQPRADWVREGLAEYAPDARVGLDLSPYSGPFLGELCRDKGLRITAGFWLADLDVDAPPRSVTVKPLTLGTLSTIEPVEFVTAFEAVERAPDLGALVDRLAAVIRPGGLLFLTSPNADGFDVQVLWDRAPALTPPDKLNVPSIAGLTRRFGGPAWEIVELSTPGVFDVEHVRRAVDAAPALDWPRFVRTLVRSRDADAQRDYQEYLQRHRLASFARMIVRRGTK